MRYKKNFRCDNRNLQKWKTVSDVVANDMFYDGLEKGNLQRKRQLKQRDDILRRSHRQKNSKDDLGLLQESLHSRADYLAQSLDLRRRNRLAIVQGD